MLRRAHHVERDDDFGRSFCGFNVIDATMRQGDDFLQVFDPGQDVLLTKRRLPHWAQARTICFITWRTSDSIPKRVLQQWIFERDVWLKRHGIRPDSVDWMRQLDQLDLPRRREFHRLLASRWHAHLDACHGDCVLQRPELAAIVATSLHHFDNDRYVLTDFVVMPNHVHLLAAFPDEASMLKQCSSWKQYTATRINRRIGRNRRFWQQDAFDHLVRSLDQFEYYRRYIKDNPQRARLQPGQFLHFSKSLPK